MMNAARFSATVSSGATTRRMKGNAMTESILATVALDFGSLDLLGPLALDML
jgi:hypothetical protein